MVVKLRRTNESIARRIGLSHSGVSRIRSGTRIPLLSTMAAIEKAFGWPLSAQAVAAHSGTYASEFELRVVKGIRGIPSAGVPDDASGF